MSVKRSQLAKNKTDPNYPQEYLDGRVEFFSLPFMVTPAVLIPRLETETIVREAIRIARARPGMTLIDVGTGCGIIAISTTLHAPLAQTYMSDTSKRALQIAIHNATFHGIDCEWVQADLLVGFIRGTRPIGLEVLVTANLPYIRQDDWENMSSDTRFEPPEALFGGPVTGFELYERFFESLEKLYRKRKLSYVCALIEIGYDQKDVCETILSQYGWSHTYIKDPAGIDRCVRIEI